MKSYWLYRLATLLVPFLPERFGYWLFSRLGDLAFLFGRKARRRYLNNLKHVLGPNADPARVRSVTRLAFQNLLKNYYDLFRSHRLSKERLRSQFSTMTGFEHLDTALKRGEGLVAGSIHMGNFNLFVVLSGLYLKEHGDIIVPVERIEPPRLFDLVKNQRALQGVEIVPVDEAARALIRGLKAGAAVGLSLDFDPTRTGPVVEFFGAQAQLPDGAVALALKYRSPLIVGFTRRLPNNRCIVQLEPPIQLTVTGDLASDTRAGVQQIARLIEKWIRDYPEQWILFESVWKD